MERKKNEIKKFIYEEADKSRMLSLESLDFSADTIRVDLYVSVVGSFFSGEICHPVTLKTGIQIALSLLEEKIPFGIKVKDVCVDQLVLSIEELRRQFVILY